MADTFAPNWDLQLETGEYLSATGYLSLVQSVTVDASIDGADELTITAVARDPTEGVYRFMGEAILAPGNTVVVLVGYGYNLVALQRFTIVAEDGNYPDGGVPTVTIRGYSAEHGLGQFTGERIFKGPAKASDVVKAIADEFGLAYDDDTIVATDDFDDGWVKPKGTSDLEFLQQLAVQADYGPPMVRYDADKGADVVYFRPTTVDPATQITLVYNPFDAGADLPSGTLRSFQPSIDLSGVPTKVQIVGWDAVKQEAVVVIMELTDEGQETQILTGSSASQAGYKIKSASGMVLQQLETGSDPAKEKGDSFHLPQLTTTDQAVAFGRAWLTTRNRAAMTGRATVLGDQSLWIGQVHDFQGLAETHNGLWEVTGCRHVLDSSGYTVELDVARVLEDMPEPTEG